MSLVNLNTVTNNSQAFFSELPPIPLFDNPSIFMSSNQSAQPNNSLYNIFNNYFSNNTLSSTNQYYIKDYAEEFRQNTKTARNLPSGTLKALGYNAEKGQKLANIAVRNTVGFTGNCARYAKEITKEPDLANMNTDMHINAEIFCQKTRISKKYQQKD